jgi:hypothetical protein
MFGTTYCKNKIVRNKTTNNASQILAAQEAFRYTSINNIP